MGNRICFNSESTQEGIRDLDLKMTNGGTSVFINVLCLSGGRLAETESQKRFMVFLAEQNQEIYGNGTIGFDIVEMPWDKNSFGEDKAFMLRVIEGARKKLGWETLLRYTPNEERIYDDLSKFQKLIERMTADDIIEASLSEWLSDISKSAEKDPIRCGFPKCKIHDAYIGVYGCQICME